MARQRIDHDGRGELLRVAESRRELVEASADFFTLGNAACGVGAIFLAIVAVLPYLISPALGLGNQILLGGTSMLIVVGVSLDTVRQLESQLMMRNYEGFLKKR